MFVIVGIFPGLFYSCKDKPHANQTAFSESGKSHVPVNDSVGDCAQKPFEFDTYEEEGHLDLNDYFIAILSGHYSSDRISYSGSFFPQRNLLIVRNKANNTADTMLMKTSDYLDGVVISELSDSLRFKRPFLQMKWSGDSDMPTFEFAGYKDDTLRSFFGITFLESLQRKDEWTLTGLVAGRDEVVSGTQHDYPVTISLKDYTIVEEEPPVQYLGGFTHANESIKGTRLFPSGKREQYTIRKGTELTVDTIYRKKGIVRLVLPDSIIVEVPVRVASENLQHDTAG